VQLGEVAGQVGCDRLNLGGGHAGEGVAKGCAWDTRHEDVGGAVGLEVVDVEDWGGEEGVSWRNGSEEG
jgi:hypothetical protein